MTAKITAIFSIQCFNVRRTLAFVRSGWSKLRKMRSTNPVFPRLEPYAFFAKTWMQQPQKLKRISLKTILWSGFSLVSDQEVTVDTFLALYQQTTNRKRFDYKRNEGTRTKENSLAIGRDLCFVSWSIMWIFAFYASFMRSFSQSALSIGKCAPRQHRCVTKKH